MSRTYDAVVVGISNDETGISEDPDVRFEIARRIVERAQDYGIKPEDVIIDPLVMPIGAIGQAGNQVFALVKRLRQELKVNTTCGASNISFGLPNRHGINNAFLPMAMATGMTSAIMNPVALPVTQAAIAGAMLAVLGQRNDIDVATYGGLAISAACLGFAPFNAWRPMLFLGDVGSYFIGFWLAALVVVVIANGADPLVAIAPFLLYIADSATTIVRRARRGDDIMSAHREHAYQRLVQRGWSHVRVTLLVGVLVAITSLAMLAVDGRAPSLRVAMFAAAIVTAIGFTALPAALDGRQRTA